MGFLDSLLRVAKGVDDAAGKYVEKQTSEYYSGYNAGQNRASNMSDSELRSELRRAKENGISGMENAGKTKAMLDEYKERNK